MNTFKRSRDFSVRPSTGSLRPAEPRFSTGFRVTVAGVEVEVSDEEVVAAALRIVASRLLHSSPLMSPRHSREYVSLRFSGLEYEVFSCLYLDNRHRVIAFEELFRGTIDGSIVHPREVVKQALVHNAAAVIFAHNHPSGVAEPSTADELITQRLKHSLALVDIQVLDHLVVGGGVVESFAERGLL